MSQPEFITNGDGKTVAESIKSLLNNLSKLVNNDINLDISTAYLNPGGFSLLAESLEKLNNVRVLLGSDPDISTSKIRKLKDNFEDLESSRILNALEGQYKTMEEDRNLLGFTYEEDSSARRLIKWLKSGKVKTRRFEKGFLHGKAWIVSNPTSNVIAGSSNFTFAGLSINKELNLGQYQPSVVNQVQKWFDDIWDQSEEFDLSKLFAARYEEHSPYLIYLKMLWERYKQEIEEENGGSFIGINLTGFQEDGVARARRILAKNRGVLIADGVGLGKSFIAAALMREAIIEQRQRVLLIAPAALRDGPWRSFQNRHADFPFECISFEELRDAMDPNKPKALNNPINEYAMIVIDEAHGFRNPDTERSSSLRQILQGLPSKKLVLLTATPVNNSIWDLYYELIYFLKNDSAFASQGIRSIKGHFQEVSAKDPEDLSPKDLFDILDQVAVRRTRHFIKTYYAGDVIDNDGDKITIQFPKPEVQRISYDLNKVLPNFFKELKNSLDADLRDPETFKIPDEKIGIALSLARYIPSSYLKNPSLKSNEVQISGLLLSGLLKRFESSSIAFSKTCERMAKANEAFLKALDGGKVLKGEDLVEWMSTETDDLDDFLNEKTKGEPVKSYDIERLKKAVLGDKLLLEKFSKITNDVSAKEDPKLEKLIETLSDISIKADEDGLTNTDKRNNSKTLIFSYFKDTAEWIYEFLVKKSKDDPRLSKFKNRITLVSGEDSSRETSVFGFAPVSTESPSNEDLYDILITTDVLSEGVNLQQARNIINYDLPWNPMKLVQRHGRIDRIGSNHKRIFMKCFFPDEDLDDLLGLEYRLKIKLSAASAGVGVENEVIPDSRIVEVNFTENREEIEKLRKENPEIFETGGERGNAVSGEEYRQYLRKSIKSPEVFDQIKNLPWGSGSGKEGEVPGFVFCAKVASEDKPIFRFISHEVDNEPEIISDTLSCLSHAYADDTTLRKLDDKTLKKAYDAWALAKNDIYEKWEHLTHPINIQPKVPKAMRDAQEILRKSPPPDLSQENINKLINSLDSDYGIRVQRKVREAIIEGKSIQEKSKLIVSVVNEIGLEPSEPPKPLSPISPEDVHLLCWIAII